MKKQEKQQKTWINKLLNFKVVKEARLVGAMALATLQPWFAGAQAGERIAAPNDVKVNTSMAVGATARSYPGRYYNEICNGSPCWLASTYETNGARNSIACWNDKGNYRGLNQISPQNAQSFLQWLQKQPQYAALYTALAQGGIGKQNWQHVATEQEHLMTKAFEYYMVGEYSAPNMKYIQDKLDEAHIDVNLHDLHPAILSCFHQITVERPKSREQIVAKMKNWVVTHGTDIKQFNSPEFIDELLPHRPAVAKRAKALLTDKTIRWQEDQFASLLRQVRKPRVHTVQHDRPLSYYQQVKGASDPKSRVENHPKVPGLNPQPVLLSEVRLRQKGGRA